MGVLGLAVECAVSSSCWGVWHVETTVSLGKRHRTADFQRAGCHLWKLIPGFSGLCAADAGRDFAAWIFVLESRFAGLIMGTLFFLLFSHADARGQFTACVCVAAIARKSRDSAFRRILVDVALEVDLYVEGARLERVDYGFE